MSIIPFDDRDGYIWMNGEVLPWRDTKTHVISHGLHYASLVFEGERAYNGKIFKSLEHTNRLFNSASILDMTIPWTSNEIEEAKLEMLKVMKLSNSYVRAFAWRGSEMIAVSAQNTKVHTAIAAWEWPSMFDPEAKMRGIKLDISKWRRPPAECAPVHAKAAGLYMICTLAKHEAEKKGFDDTLMLSHDGLIAEATGANIFFRMSDGNIHTPLPNTFLNGITRKTVIELLRNEGLKVLERDINLDELENVTECFLTGTAAEVTPVGKISKFEFKPGNLSKKIMVDYSELVRSR
jgi:branched-chain amino acid aminotransferase